MLGFCALAQTLPGVPAKLKPPAGETPGLRAQAVGDQVYSCDGTSWTLVKPDAKLLGNSGKQIGLHFVGRTWQ